MRDRTWGLRPELLVCRIPAALEKLQADLRASLFLVPLGEDVKWCCKEPEFLWLLSPASLLIGDLFSLDRKIKGTPRNGEHDPHIPHPGIEAVLGGNPECLHELGDEDNKFKYSLCDQDCVLALVAGPS